MDRTIGSLMLFAGNFAPVGFAVCDGSLLNITGNEALYSILTTTYGGDGINTFGLPDLSDKTPVQATSSNLGTATDSIRPGAGSSVTAPGIVGMVWCIATVGQYPSRS